MSRTHRPPLPQGNIPGTHFCQRLSQPQDHSAVGRIMSMKNSSDTIGNRTRELAACSAVPQPTAPPHILLKHVAKFDNQKGIFLPTKLTRKGEKVNFFRFSYIFCYYHSDGLHFDVLFVGKCRSRFVSYEVTCN